MRTLYHNKKTIRQPSDDLAKVQNFRQEQNKSALAAYLAEATVDFKGKQYGVSEADQQEIQEMIAQYQMLTQAGVPTTLEWHAKHEECSPFELEEMVQLVATIKAFVLPCMKKMQEIKAAIYQAETSEEVMAIDIFAAPGEIGS